MYKKYSVIHIIIYIMHYIYLILYIVYYILNALYYIYSLSYMGSARNVRFKFVMYTQLSYYKQLQGYRW